MKFILTSAFMPFITLLTTHTPKFLTCCIYLLVYGTNFSFHLAEIFLFCSNFSIIWTLILPIKSTAGILLQEFKYWKTQINYLWCSSSLCDLKHTIHVYLWFSFSTYISVVTPSDSFFALMYHVHLFPIHLKTTLLSSFLINLKLKFFLILCCCKQNLKSAIFF